MVFHILDRTAEVKNQYRAESLAWPYHAEKLVIKISSD